MRTAARDQLSNSSQIKEAIMAADSVYRITELVGTSNKSWEDAAANAVNAASKTLHDLRVAEVIKLDMVVEDGKVAAYRAKVALSFKYNPKK
jgi:flavin-binding protein dodecin